MVAAGGSWSEGNAARLHVCSPEVVSYAAAALLCAALPGPAAAQVAASLSIASDVRLRGFSLNGGGAALTASLAYDDASGLYAGATATAGDTRRFGLQFLSRTANFGYARRLTRTLSSDVGIVDTYSNSNVYQRFSGHYTEVYAGLATEHVIARVFYTPSFFKRGLQAVYFDLNATVRASPHLRFFGHGGLLIPLVDRGDAVLPRARYDLRFGGAREIGRAEFQIAWVHSGADEYFLRQRQQTADALVAGATWAF